MHLSVRLFVHLLNTLSCLGEECVDEDGECRGGEEGGDWVPEAEDGLLLVIGPGQLTHNALQLHQERPEQWHDVKK